MDGAIGNYADIALLLPVVILLYQIFRFAVNRCGVEKQRSCQILGIVYCTLGVGALAVHTVFSVLSGLFLLMFGLRLIASGLDRLNRTLSMDHFAEDDEPEKGKKKGE